MYNPDVNPSGQVIKREINDEGDAEWKLNWKTKQP
jgi:hypothetical protein